MTCPHQDWKFESVEGQIVKVCIKCGEPILSIKPINKTPEELAEWLKGVIGFEPKFSDGQLRMFPIRKE